MTIRMTFLNDRLLALCGPGGRLTPPKGWNEGSQRDELAVLARALDGAAPTSGYEPWWSQFEMALLGGLNTRAWPTVSDIMRAAREMREADKARAAAAPTPGPADEPPHLYQMVEEWWLKFREPGPGSVPKAHHAPKLVTSGHATYGELWRVGFPIPAWSREIAKAEKDLHHEAVMVEIRAIRDRLRANHTGLRNPAFARAAE